MVSNKIKYKLVDRGLKVSDLARLLNTSHQNLSQKLKRDNFNTSELEQIADALGYDLVIDFKERT